MESFNQDTINEFSKIIKHKGIFDAHNKACEYVVDNIDYGSMDEMTKYIDKLIELAKANKPVENIKDYNSYPENGEFSLRPDLNINSESKLLMWLRNNENKFIADSRGQRWKSEKNVIYYKPALEPKYFPVIFKGDWFSGLKTSEKL